MINYSKASGSSADTGDSGDLPFIYAALPVMDEPELLPQLLSCIAAQTNQRFKLVICVNQPDSWWTDPVKQTVCHHNRDVIKLLKNWNGCELEVLDHSSKGRGWSGKHHGVGMARKVTMDHVNREANPWDIIISLDADTTFSPHYFSSIAENFAGHPEMVALAVPYRHNLTGDEIADRAILRYEIYMRHFFLNMAFIRSPYTFTALGSAMAVPVRAYRAIGGMTPKQSGEDFYFLQKLKKFGYVGLWNDELVHPAARFSDRVFFGTGPAMIKGASGDWASYPIYPGRLFDQIQETYNMIPGFFHSTTDTAVVKFISEVFREADPFLPLRRNHRDAGRFTRAFHEKFDGLRILQYLKTANERESSSDEQNLADFLFSHYPGWQENPINTSKDLFSFLNAPVTVLSAIRDFLFDREMEYRATSALQ